MDTIEIIILNNPQQARVLLMNIAVNNIQWFLVKITKNSNKLKSEK